MRIIFVFLVAFLLSLGIFFIFKQPKKPQASVFQNSIKKIKIQKVSPKESYIFIPYWALDLEIASIPYDKLMYFGIAADKNGIITDDSGFKNTEMFTKNSGAKEKLLVLRMLNTDTNLEILKNTKLQDKIIKDAVLIAKKHNFRGLVLDLEIQGLPFESLVNSITNLHALFVKELHGKKLSFGTLLYGDTFYRIRPYDVKGIAKNVDRVYVMAYDFSKAKGNPGPNFPFSDAADLYGYDFKSMVSDFSKNVPKEKLTIIFGMFGYDWNIDEKGRSKDTAVSKTTLQFEKKRTVCLDNNSCKTDIDKNAEETKIEYEDLDEKHVIWFENNYSMNKKTTYLRLQKLYSVGYWAYTYF